MKHFNKSTVFALLSGIIFLSCSDLFVWDGDPEGPQNVFVFSHQNPMIFSIATNKIIAGYSHLSGSLSASVSTLVY